MPSFAVTTPRFSACLCGLMTVIVSVTSRSITASFFTHFACHFIRHHAIYNTNTTENLSRHLSTPTPLLPPFDDRRRHVVVRAAAA